MTPEESIQGVESAALELGRAMAFEQELEDGRCLAKQAAILRIMQGTNPLTQKQHSASSAEAVVESDTEYAIYRKAQSASAVASITARGKFEAAKCRATLTIAREALGVV